MLDSHLTLWQYYKGPAVMESCLVDLSLSTMSAALYPNFLSCQEFEACKVLINGNPTSPALGKGL
jgi:hypothetical protein